MLQYKGMVIITIASQQLILLQKKTIFFLFKRNEIDKNKKITLV